MKTGRKPLPPEDLRGHRVTVNLTKQEQSDLNNAIIESEIDSQDFYRKAFKNLVNLYDSKKCPCSLDAEFTVDDVELCFSCMKSKEVTRATEAHRKGDYA